jgi:pimeloyl-ACP methyl ester carboxylesterase
VSETIERFHIHVDDSVLEDLRRRLAGTRFPDQIEGTGREYGIPIDYVRALVAYWRDEYDWRAQEARLNALPHFRTRIDGQSIHFVHARSARADAFPLLITRGWPGSVVEFVDVIPRLTDPEAHGGRAADAFHVIAPSLPGYGSSEPTRTRGWNAQRIARAFIELMRRLGYERYGAQGGDWGAQVATRIGALDAEHCAAIHLNMPIARRPKDPGPLSDEEQADLAAMAHFQREEVRLRARAGDQAADARRRAQRLARRAARLDRGEAPHLERLRRGRAAAPARRRMAHRQHQRQALGRLHGRRLGRHRLGAHGGSAGQAQVLGRRGRAEGQVLPVRQDRALDQRPVLAGRLEPQVLVEGRAAERLPGDGLRHRGLQRRGAFLGSTQGFQLSESIKAERATVSGVAGRGADPANDRRIPLDPRFFDYQTLSRFGK